jgi:SPP1 gp7 family putative phage head morphogenesis protein
VTKQSRYHDVMTRHQIYVECVKLGIAASFNAFASKLVALIRRRLNNLNVTSLDQLTKVQLQLLIRQIHSDQLGIYNEYIVAAHEQLRDFAFADLAVTKFVFKYLQAEDSSEQLPTIPDKTKEDDTLGKVIGAGLFGLALLAGSGAGNTRLWAIITNSPLPANGAMPMQFLSGSTVSAMASVESEIRKGYANRSKVADVVNTIVGTTSKNNQDGVIARVFNQQSAVINTLAQHATSVVKAATMSSYFDYYFWSSIIDGKTTVICQERDGNRYRFGEGPLPPAHIGCRSDIVPSVGTDSESPNYTWYNWLKSQPSAFLSDILSPSKLQALESGKLRAKDVPKFEDATPITISQFAQKLSLILNP